MAPCVLAICYVPASFLGLHAVSLLYYSFQILIDTFLNPLILGMGLVCIVMLMDGCLKLGVTESLPRMHHRDNDKVI